MSDKTKTRMRSTQDLAKPDNAKPRGWCGGAKQTEPGELLITAPVSKLVTTATQTNKSIAPKFDGVQMPVASPRIMVYQPNAFLSVSSSPSAMLVTPRT